MSIQERIAANALNHVGSTKWAIKTQKDNIKADVHKCNKFVYDVLLETGIDMGNPNPTKSGRWVPIFAGQWGNPDNEILGWEIVATPQVGDIAAYKNSYADATGHVGIVVSNNGIGVWANEEVIRKYSLSIWKTHGNPIIYRRFVGFPTTLPGN
jgi:cell wall-associated NlpC family hydrolase